MGRAAAKKFMSVSCVFGSEKTKTGIQHNCGCQKEGVALEVSIYSSISVWDLRAPLWRWREMQSLSCWCVRRDFLTLGGRLCSAESIQIWGFSSPWQSWMCTNGWLHRRASAGTQSRILTCMLDRLLSEQSVLPSQPESAPWTCQVRGSEHHLCNS